MPHSDEAERALLGAILEWPERYHEAAELVDAAAFYEPAHRTIFGGMAAMVADSEAVDLVALFERLQRQGKADEAGGMAYLNELVSGAVVGGSIKRHAQIVAERASERALIQAVQDAQKIAWASAESLEDRQARIAEALRRAETVRKGPAAHRVPLLGLAELRQSAEAVSWLCKRVVPADSIGMLFGGSGTFKTYMALDFALHVCHGLPWMGRKTRKGAVIYIAAEGGTGLWSRIQAWHAARNLDWRKADLRVVPVAVDLGQDAWRIVDAAQAIGVTPSLVVVDTLSQTYAGEENSANEMAAYLRTLGQRFRALWHCTVLLIHHSGHAATERPRGSSAIRSNVDFLLGVFRDEKEMLATLCCIKQKDGDLFEEAVFQLSAQVLGTDEDGDTISQLVARHLSSVDEVTQVMQSEGKAGRGGKNQLLLSLVQNGMEEKALRKAFYEDCDLDNNEARRQAYHRAKAWAQKAGYMEVSEGFVIVTKPYSAA